MSDEWPRSKYSISRLSGCSQIPTQKSEVSPEIIQKIANNMNDVIPTINKPNSKMIDINVDTELEELSSNGYRILKKNQGKWNELPIDNQK